MNGRSVEQHHVPHLKPDHLLGGLPLHPSLDFTVQDRVLGRLLLRQLLAELRLVGSLEHLASSNCSESARSASSNSDTRIS